jgi:Zn-dependent metalloprotease
MQFTYLYPIHNWDSSKVESRLQTLFASLATICLLSFSSTVFAQSSSTPGGEPQTPLPSKLVVKQAPSEDGGSLSASQVPDFKQFEQGAEIPYRGFQTWFSETFDLRQEDGLKLEKSEQDQLGFTHYRFRQWFHNYPVEFGEYLLHVKNGQIKSMNGNFIMEVVAPKQPKVAEKAALQKALEHVGAAKVFVGSSRGGGNHQKGFG